MNTYRFKGIDSLSSMQVSTKEVEELETTGRQDSTADTLGRLGKGAHIHLA